MKSNPLKHIMPQFKVSSWEHGNTFDMQSKLKCYFIGGSSRGPM